MDLKNKKKQENLISTQLNVEQAHEKNIETV